MVGSLGWVCSKRAAVLVLDEEFLVLDDKATTVKRATPSRLGNEPWEKDGTSFDQMSSLLSSHDTAHQSYYELTSHDFNMLIC